MRSPLRILRDLRFDERGTIGVEFILVFAAWAAAAAFLGNVCLVFSNEVTMQDQLNRAALQASADGCFDPQVAARFSGMTSLMKRNVTLVARHSRPVPTGASPQHGFDPASVYDGQQPVAVTSETNADCSPSANGGQDSVPGGDRIWLHLRYKQKLFGFGSITIERTSLVVSNSLQKP